MVRRGTIAGALVVIVALLVLGSGAIPWRGDPAPTAIDRPPGGAGGIAGVFRATGPMAGGCFLGCEPGTLLPDGRVLVRNDAGLEIYQPTTRTFIGADPRILDDASVPVALQAGRSLLMTSETTGRQTTITIEAADVLADGRQLFIGNEEEGGRSLVGLYDPGSGRFRGIDRPTSLGPGASVTTLPDGRALIAGGRATVIYDPSTDALAPAGSMRRPRQGHAAAVLDDGRVLLVGGWGLDTAEIYDPATGTITEVPARMTQVRHRPGAVTLPDGEVLIYGHWPGNVPGHENDAPMNTAEVFSLP